MTKVGDIVKLTANGGEFNAEVVREYGDVDQKYVDVKVLDGGPNRGALYQAVNPKGEVGEDSIFHFEALKADEQKAVRSDLEAEKTEDLVVGAPVVGQAPVVPDEPKPKR